VLAKALVHLIAIEVESLLVLKPFAVLYKYLFQSLVHGSSYMPYVSMLL